MRSMTLHGLLDGTVVLHKRCVLLQHCSSREPPCVGMGTRHTGLCDVALSTLSFAVDQPSFDRLDVHLVRRH